MQRRVVATSNSELSLFPHPEKVGVYVKQEEFSKHRLEGAQWVHWRDRVNLIIDGRYDDVKPLHVELSPTWVCNFACSWCNMRSARQEWTDSGDVFHRPIFTDETTASLELLKHVIDHLADDEVGIQWVGGEPTLNPAIYDAMEYAQSKGLKQALFTNGSALNEESTLRLLNCELVFVRFSLNATSAEVHARFHGYESNLRLGEKVLSNLERFAQRKLSTGNRTLCGVSFVIDDDNIGDLRPSVMVVADIAKRVGKGGIDYVVCRPAYKLYGNDVTSSRDFRNSLLSVLSPNGEIARLVESSGIQFLAPTEAPYKDQVVISQEFSDRCLSCGWFGEIKPSGELMVCSDRYGHPDFVIGDIGKKSLAQIWSSDQRSTVLKMIQHEKCLKEYCPRSGRGFYLNGIFHQIEALRHQGRINDVKRWIAELRKVVPNPGHSFYI